MKADRLLSALMLLQGHGRLTGRELAKRLEVSERTVHRDMEALSAAGVPVYALRGAQGGWQLAEGWQTSVPGLEEQELRALLMAQPPRVLGDLRLASAAERAMGKLMASLPAAMRQQAVSIRERLFIDVEGWRGSRENLSMLPIVQEAVWRDRQLQIRYVRGGRDTAARGTHRHGLEPRGHGDVAGRCGPRWRRTHRPSPRPGRQGQRLVSGREHGRWLPHVPHFAHRVRDDSGRCVRAPGGLRSGDALEDFDDDVSGFAAALRRDACASSRTWPRG